jgi:hypothetical protein
MVRKTSRIVSFVSTPRPIDPAHLSTSTAWVISWNPVSGAYQSRPAFALWPLYLDRSPALPTEELAGDGARFRGASSGLLRRLLVRRRCHPPQPSHQSAIDDGETYVLPRARKSLKRSWAERKPSEASGRSRDKLLPR